MCKKKPIRRACLNLPQYARNFRCVYWFSCGFGTPSTDKQSETSKYIDAFDSWVRIPPEGNFGSQVVKAQPCEG